MAEAPHPPSAFDEIDALQNRPPDERELANEALAAEAAETSRAHVARGNDEVALTTNEFSRMVFAPNSDAAAYNQWNTLRDLLEDVVTALREGPEDFVLGRFVSLQHLALESYVDAEGRPVVGLRATGADATFKLGGRETYRLAEGSRLLQAPGGEDGRPLMRVWDAPTFEQQRDSLGLREAPARQFPFATPNHPHPQEGQSMDNQAPHSPAEGTNTPAAIDVKAALEDPETAADLRAAVTGAEELRGHLREVRVEGEPEPGKALYAEGDVPLRIPLGDGRYVEVPPGAALVLGSKAVKYLAPNTPGLQQLVNGWRQTRAGAPAAGAAATETAKTDGTAPQTPDAQDDTGVTQNATNPNEDTRQPGQQQNTQKQNPGQQQAAQAAQQMGGGLAALGSALGQTAAGVGKAGVAAVTGATAVGVATLDAAKTLHTNHTNRKIAKTNARAAGKPPAATDTSPMGRCKLIGDHCTGMNKAMEGMQNRLSQLGLAATPYAKMTPAQREQYKTDPQVRAYSEQITSYGDALRDMATPEFSQQLADMAGDRNLSVAERQRVTHTMKQLDQTRENIDGRYRDLPVGRDKGAKGKNADEPVALSERFKELTERMREVMRKVMAAVANMFGKKSSAPRPGA